MKAYICILSVLVAVVCINASPEHGQMHQLFDECSSELGLEKPAEKPSGPPNFDDPKIKCLFACMMKKGGKMENGKVVLEKEIEGFSKHGPGLTDSDKEKLTECVNTANGQTDECEVAAAMHKCVHEKMRPPK